VPDRIQSGRILLDQGVAGLLQLLEAAGAPSLTFDQETQIRNLHDVFKRELESLLRQGRDDEERFRRTLSEQLFRGAVKFLNPVQRVAMGGLPDEGANSDLPVDENELREYLRDLTSPVSTGGDDDDDVVIDGFSGGRMPNRDEILEIRINDNAFTSEQSFQGRGRTEIRTRGGAGRFNGDAEFEFEDESLDARNAFAAFRPPYQTRDFTANLSGPVIRDRLTATLGVSNDFSEQGDTLRAITPSGLIDAAITRPGIERSVTFRATTQINANHAFNFSYSYAMERNENNGVGGFGLPEQASIEKETGTNFQIQQVAILSPAISHETRFRINTETQRLVPLNTGPHIVVPDAFTGGGSPGSGSARDREVTFGNLLMFTGKNVSIKTGFDGTYRRERSDSRDNFNGTFTFANIQDYIDGRPLQYSVNQGNPLLDVRQFEAASFLQTDFRLTSRWTMGLGARYEAQTNISDRNNFDPRVGFAYHVGGSTVFRGGSGIFHERFGIWDLQDLLRFDGERQRSIIIQNPSYPNPFQTGDLTVRIPSSIRVRSTDLTTPYMWHSEASVETKTRFGLVLTGSYRFVRGLHLYRGRNLNAPLDIASATPRSCRAGQSAAECVRPDPSRGNIVQIESTGLASNHQIEFGFQQRLSFINIRGNYITRVSHSDVLGESFDLPADNYNMASEWGPTEPRRDLNTNVNLRLPWKVDADMNFNWNSGTPYSIVTGRDDNQDTNTSDRPAGIARNSLTGPSFFEIDLNFSKTITLIPEGSSDANSPLAGGGYFGRRSGVRMTITAEAENVLNKVNYDRISGVLTSPFFGLPTRARDGRQISVSARFNF
jgi:hypothetical protein